MKVNVSLEETANRLLLVKAEIKVWADRNFPTTTSGMCVLGVIEEIGELSHAILKEAQGIRKEDFLLAKKDAIADISIYLMDYMNRKGLCNIDATTEITYNSDLDSIIMVIQEMSVAASALNQHHIDEDLEYCNYLFTNLYNLSNALGIDYIETVEEVWKKVSKRDWLTFPKNGLTE